MTQMLTAASSADRVAFSRCQEVNPEIVRVLGRNLISDRFVGELVTIHGCHAVGSGFPVYYGWTQECSVAIEQGTGTRGRRRMWGGHRARQRHEAAAEIVVACRCGATAHGVARIASASFWAMSPVDRWRVGDTF
jgi:hypothetical protein